MFKNAFVTILLSIQLVNMGCSDEMGSFLTPPLNNAILVISGDANHRGVAIYDLEGNLISQITHFRNENKTPRGLVLYDNMSFLVAHDTTDSIERVFFNGHKETFHGSAYFSGAIYGITKAFNKVFAVESSRIEAFDSNGARNASFYINTTVGSCSLSSPRDIITNKNNQIVAVDYNNHRINTYDISSTPTCVSSNILASNTRPYGITEHSNGKIYVTTFNDDTIYEADPDGSNATSIWTTDLTILRDPTAIIELPNGDLLVASSYLDTIERITTDGTRVGSMPFIRDQNTLNVTDMLLIKIGGQN